MAWIDAFRSKRGGRTQRGTNDDLRYLAEWTAARTGVEAYVEPQTNFSDVTVILIAGDGEWTRRRVGGAAGARRISERLQIPVYDVHRTGYPQRKRDYDARQKSSSAGPHDFPRRVSTFRAKVRVDGPKSRHSPGGGGGYPLVAMSSSTPKMVRTGTPVPPLGV